MSGKLTRRARKEFRKMYRAELTGFWMMPFWQRVKVAWQIVRGKL
jgi:hypothetical protein